MAKHLDENTSAMLVAGIVAMFLGILTASGYAAKGGKARVPITERQVAFLSVFYRWALVLSVLGYIVWIGSAIGNGVSLTDLSSVVNRDSGAISELKSMSRPIGGVTTITQFGPVAVAIGVILRKLGNLRRRSYWILYGLGAIRTLFYAERLALIEVLLPVLLIAAFTATGRNKRATLIRALPIIAAPLVWALFAISEFTRSWVYYQGITSLPFPQWVTLRLIGYYTTSFDNSALFYQSRVGALGAPYFTFQGFWNAPWAGPAPVVGGLPAPDWWTSTLSVYGNPEFNNVGSFLVSMAEFGFVWALLGWLLGGIALGWLFARLTRGSLPGLVAYVTLFIGILELSRLIYWTQGRAAPLLFALIVFGLFYPRTRSADCRTDHVLQGSNESRVVEGRVSDGRGDGAGRA